MPEVKPQAKQEIKEKKKKFRLGYSPNLNDISEWVNKRLDEGYEILSVFFADSSQNIMIAMQLREEIDDITTYYEKCKKWEAELHVEKDQLQKSQEDLEEKQDTLNTKLKEMREWAKELEEKEKDLKELGSDLKKREDEIDVREMEESRAKKSEKK